ncbi:MAG TPA: acyltransferase, partial [Candidatus Hydrogenedentes bacterium]|nr:acyltransferase [Candidatus Hydrogenedentota bacterium]
ALYALLEPVLCVGISVGLLTAFRARWNRETPAWRFAADSAYAAYIIHPFFVIGAACLMRDWTVDPLLKFPVLCLLSTTSAFVAASFIRRIPLFRRVL